MKKLLIAAFLLIAGSGSTQTSRHIDARNGFRHSVYQLERATDRFDESTGRLDKALKQTPK